MDSQHDTSNQHSEQHAIVLQVKEHAERVEQALNRAIDSDDDAEKRALLDQALEDVTTLEQLADTHDFLTLPPLDGIRRGMADLALRLYRDGACDTLSESDQQAFLDAHAIPLTTIEGIGPVTARRLFVAGITHIEALRGLSRDDLEAIPGITNATLARIQAGLSVSSKAS